ncbi:MAG: BglG family transcription antiterminator [Enterococcus avium]
MDFTKRETKLLECLLYTPREYITRAELAKELQVSERTIGNDVHHLNRKKMLVKGKRGMGYCLQDKELVNNLLNERTQESWNLHVKLFKRIIDQGVSDFYELADSFFISEGTLTNNIQKMNASLAAYGFQTKILRKNNQIYCSGTTNDKKTALRKFLVDEVVENELNITILDNYFGNFDCITLKEDLVTFYEREGRPILDYSLMSVLLHILLLLEKIEQTKKLVVPQHLSADPFQDLILAIETGQRICLPTIVVKKIKQLVTEETRSSPLYEQTLLMDTYFYLLVTEIKDNYQIDLANDEQFKKKFQSHMWTLLKRCENKQFIRNPMLQDIKNKFPLIYDISATMVAEIQKQMLFSIPEAEIGYIALHLISAIEDMNAETINMMIVNPYSQTITDVIKKKVLASFPEINITVCSKLSFKAVTNQQVDLVVSLIPLDVIPTVPVYYLDTGILGGDVSELLLTIRQVKYQKRFCDFTIKNYFKKEFFYPKCQVTSKDELLKFLCTHLMESQVVPPEFEQSVFKRELAAPTSFGGVLAIPHATTKMAKETVISVATLGKPLDWENGQVKLIFLMALSAEFSDADRLYTYILSLIEDEKRLQELLVTDSFEVFRKVLFAVT